MVWERGYNNDLTYGTNGASQGVTNGIRSVTAKTGHPESM